ncbi:DUF2867 domain-containing protein, partial [Beijerinckia sp. L45]|uniref:DUF2867 domain-containing protein n=1 Tax=Beijerinckia sp. L45 TaxID=1641855 RepID=UPI0034CDE6B2
MVPNPYRDTGPGHAVSRDQDHEAATLSSTSGSRIDFFPVFEQRPNEIVLGGNDKHLDFHMSLLR